MKYWVTGGEWGVGVVVWPIVGRARRSRQAPWDQTPVVRLARSGGGRPRARAGALTGEALAALRSTMWAAEVWGRLGKAGGPQACPKASGPSQDYLSHKRHPKEAR